MNCKIQARGLGNCHDFVMPVRKKLACVSTITFILIDIAESEVKNGGSIKFDLFNMGSDRRTCEKSIEIRGFGRLAVDGRRMVDRGM
jgi:hypothetical protein